MLPRLSPTASESRRGGTSPAQRDTSCSPGDAEEAPSLLQQPPRSEEREGKCKKQQKAAKRSPALRGRAQQKPRTSATFLPRCDAAIAPSPESSSCSPDTSNH